MAGICSVGANAIFVGVMPTPAIAYLTRKHKVDAGVVISASHNPMEFNGIKFFNGEGYKLSDELEDEIEALIRNNMKDVNLPIGSGVGKIDYRFDLRDEYVEFMKKCVPVDLTGMKMCIRDRYYAGLKKISAMYLREERLKGNGNKDWD